MIATQIQTFDAMYATNQDFSHTWNAFQNTNVTHLDHYTYAHGFIYFQQKLCVSIG